MSAVYHVAVTGCDCQAGSADAPFRTINHAAQVALPGDTVVVHAGEYREWVDPQNGGLSEALRITYEAAPGEHVVIKGSEAVTGWEPLDGGVWKKELPNAFFGGFNPFAQAVEGDWLILPDKKEKTLHLAEVYLNGMSMYEAFSVEEVRQAQPRRRGYQLPWSDHDELIPEPEETIYQWYAQVGEETTTVWVNFHDADPNAQLVEVNVRPYCFYPSRTGVSYITLRGFEICQAACPWTPPTADQPGMVGPHWSKCWIIEDCDLHDAKCSAISLGKEASTGHNLYSRFGRKPGYQYQMEAVFLGLQAGWRREKIGSHIVRNNHIHHCGQNGVVGHMGCAFSRIEHNHIHHIATKHEFFGYEIGGIKLHAGVDVLIAHNNIHHCSLGTWLDWQSQGTRVTKNLYWHNDRDFMIEVTHGPCLVDNNIMASPYSIDNMAQGTAFVHNLIAGYMMVDPVLDRATPYHFPHTTAVAGCAVVYGGDDRMMNNLFAGVAVPGWHTKPDRVATGGCAYDRQTSPEEYAQLLDDEGNTDEAKYYKVPQPVYLEGNIYAQHAKPFCKEKDPLCVAEMPIGVEEQNGEWYVTITLPETAAAHRVEAVSTVRLGMPRITEQAYENVDGTPVDFQPDVMGARRAAGMVQPGPFAQLAAGENRVLAWKK